MGPEIPHLDKLITTSHDAKILQLELKVLPGVLSPVDDSGDGMTASDLGRVDLRVPPEGLPLGAAKEASCLGRLWILIDGNKILVHQDGERCLRHGGDVAADDQRSLGHGPKSEVGLLLFVREAAIADLEHVRIVPGSWSTSLEMLLALLKVVFDRGEVVEDILGCSPTVGDRRSPAPRLLFTPIAKGEEDVTISGGERISHGSVSHSPGDSVIVAVVVLEVVNTPACPVQSVNLLVIEAASTTSACHGAGTGVNTELEVLSMDVVSQMLHAFREGNIIDDEVAIRSSFFLHPAVIEVDVVVPKFVKAERNELVDSGDEEVFRNVAGELVPGVPTHLRDLAQAIVEGTSQRRCCSSHDKGLH